MSFHVRDPETDALVREVARKRGVGITRVIRDVMDEELKRQVNKAPLMERIRDLQQEIAKRPSSGLKADKAFFNWLSGEEDD